MLHFVVSLLTLISSAAQPGPSPSQASDNNTRFITPEQFARSFHDSGKSPNHMLFVGFPVLYSGGHIPGAVTAGPASRAEGLAALKSAASHLPRSSHLVIYCGCCPLSKCPNIMPAYNELQQMGFQHIQILQLDTNFHTDWAAHGYPVVKGT